MDAFDFISRIQGAGFSVALTEENLAISPASELNDKQRDFIRSHKDELVAALKSSETILSDEGGNDLAPANDERVVVHVSEFTSAAGKRVSFDLDVPKANLPALRQSLRFQLKDNQGGGSILGKPGASDDEVRGVLVRKYGDRLATINGKDIGDDSAIPSRVTPWECVDINPPINNQALGFGEIIEGEFAEVRS